MNKYNGEKSYTRARKLLECGLRNGRDFHPAVSFLGEQQEEEQKFPLCTPASLLFPFPAGRTRVQFAEMLAAVSASLWFCLHLCIDSVE